jgi:hypothetical protein
LDVQKYISNDIFSNQKKNKKPQKNTGVKENGLCREQRNETKEQQL